MTWLGPSILLLGPPAMLLLSGLVLAAKTKRSPWLLAALAACVLQSLLPLAILTAWTFLALQ